MNKKLVVKLMMLGLVVGLVALPFVCLAQGVNPLEKKITEIANIIGQVGFALVALMVIVAGIMFVTSSGDPSKVSAAKACLMWAIIGAIVLVAAGAIAGIAGVWKPV